MTQLRNPRFEIPDSISEVRDSNGCGTTCDENQYNVYDHETQ
jgi:hypothetical protein